MATSTDTTTQQLNGRRIAVINAAAGIGPKLVLHLAERNQVVAVDRTERLANGSRVGWSHHPSITPFAADIAQTGALDKLPAEIDCVFFVGESFGSGTTLDRPATSLTRHLTAATNTLTFFSSRALSRFTWINSSTIHGLYALNVKETDGMAVGPFGGHSSIDGVGALAAENLALSYQREFGMPISVVRLFNAYGPGIERGAAYQLARTALSGRPMIIDGDGGAMRSWCYVDDAIEAIVAVATRPETIGKLLHIGNPATACSVRRLADVIESLTGTKAGCESRSTAGSENRVRVPCIEQARALIGFEPQVRLRAGLTKLIDWIKSHNDAPIVTESRASTETQRATTPVAGTTSRPSAATPPSAARPPARKTADVRGWIENNSPTSSTR